MHEERSLYEMVATWSSDGGDRIALIYGDERWSYRALLEGIDNVANGFTACGLGSGARIALLAENSPAFVLVLLAAARIGAAVAPLPVGLGADARRRALAAAECTAVVGDRSSVIVLQRQLAHDLPLYVVGGEVSGIQRLDNLGSTKMVTTVVDIDAPFILTMTSGSTGTPKPIVFSQRCKIRRALLATRDIYGLRMGEVVLVSTPMHHSLAQRSTLLPLLLGGTAVIMPRFTPHDWVRAVSENAVSFLFAVSSQLRVLLSVVREHVGCFPSLRTVVSSSASLDTAAKQELVAALDCELHECYGTSEIGCATDFSLTRNPDRRDSVGHMLPFLDIQICDKDRHPVPDKTVGEIAVRTPTAFTGYLGQPEATVAAHDPDGFFYTGDLGYLDDGWLYFRGRSKEVVITGGINVYPIDIEAVIAECPGVIECAVIGIDDEYFGEAVLAIIVPDVNNDAVIMAVQQSCTRRLAAYQRPAAYETLAALPRNAVGKIDKPSLRERFKGYDATSRLRALLLRGTTPTVGYRRPAEIDMEKNHE